MSEFWESWMVDYRRNSRVWKRAAKKWRRYSLSSSEIFNMNAEEQMMVRETATRRKELLRKVEFVDSYCPICVSPRYEHADDCELAKELET